MSSRKLFFRSALAFALLLNAISARATAQTAIAQTANAQAANAQAGARPATASVGLSPAMIDASVRPGSSYTQQFTLSNSTALALRFRCSTGDYWYDEKNGRLMTPPDTQPRSASLWVQFTPPEVVVAPHSTTKVTAVISVPQSAAGGYYTMPFFEAMPSEMPTGGRRTAFGVRLGGLLMLATEKTSQYDVEIMSGRVTPPTPTSELRLHLDTHNKGNVHARLRGILAILDAAGKPIGRELIEEQRLLPGQRDELKALWAGELAPGDYIALVTLSHERVGMEPATLIHEVPFTIK